MYSVFVIIIFCKTACRNGIATHAKHTKDRRKKVFIYSEPQHKTLTQRNGSSYLIFFLLNVFFYRVPSRQFIGTSAPQTSMTTSKIALKHNTDPHTALPPSPTTFVLVVVFCYSLCLLSTFVYKPNRSLSFGLVGSVISDRSRAPIYTQYPYHIYPIL